MRRIKPNMAVPLNQSRFKTGNPSLRPNNVDSAKRLTYTCATTTAKCIHSSVVRSACRILTPTIVIKERLKPNITAHIATQRYSAGKFVSTSLCTNAAMITARTESTRSNNSTPQNKTSDDQNLHNSNSTTFTANIYSKPRILPSPHHSSQPSTSAKFIIHLTYSDLSSRSLSPSP